MKQKYGRLVASLATFALWLAINVLVARFTAESISRLPDFLTHGVQPVFVVSILFLFASIWFFQWNDLGLNAPFSAKSLLILWLPSVFVAVIIASIFAAGPPSREATVFILVNTMMVGLSEELMFRGILFQGLRSRLSIWPSILLTSLVFGSIHLLNSVWIGGFALALLQACTAFSTGMLLMAIRLRTRSLDPSIVYHAGWDFCLATLSASPLVMGAPQPELNTKTLITAGIFALVTLSYALFLLRKVSSTEAVA
jgi:membrane protease YdiL (CAAX protease family)